MDIEEIFSRLFTHIFHFSVASSSIQFESPSNIEISHSFENKYHNRKKFQTAEIFQLVQFIIEMYHIPRFEGNEKM